MAALQELRSSAEKWEAELTVGSSRHSSMSGQGIHSSSFLQLHHARFNTSSNDFK